MSKLLVYHTGFEVIRDVDIHHGRQNADFGQGFYVSKDEEFSKRWAKKRPNTKTIMNVYELDLEGLNICWLERNQDWYKYIYNNRHGIYDDNNYDLIVGPIANDTIYDTLGIITSGYIDEKTALKMLLEGPCYEQMVLKSEESVKHLKWLYANEVAEVDLEKSAKVLKKEQEAYIKAITAILETD